MQLRIFSFRRPRRPRRGYALVSSLVAVLVLLIVGASLFSTADTGARLAHRRTLSAQAQELAFGGADLALKDLRANYLYTGFNAKTMGEGTMAATVVPVSGQPTRREITGIGVVSGRTGTFTQKVRYTVDLQDLPPALRYTLIVNDNLNLHGNIDIGPLYPGDPVSVHTNGDASFNGSAVDVTGKVTATGTISQTGTPKISEGTTSGATPVEFPPIDDTYKDMALSDGIGNGSKTVDDGSLVKGAITGNLTINSPNGCRIEGVVWVSGTVTVRGPVTGNGTIVAEDRLNLDADSLVDLLDTSKILYVTLSDNNNAVSLTGNSVFRGVIMAPNGGVHLQGSPTLYGAIACDRISLGGSPKIIGWDGFLSGIEGAPGAVRILGWQALTPQMERAVANDDDDDDDD